MIATKFAKINWSHLVAHSKIYCKQFVLVVIILNFFYYIKLRLNLKLVALKKYVTVHFFTIK